MTDQFDLKFFNLNLSCGTQALLQLGVSIENLANFAKIAKLQFFSPLLGYHPTAQTSSAWTLDGIVKAIKHFRLECGVVFVGANYNYLLYPSIKTNQMIVLKDYHYTLQYFPWIFLRTCKQMSLDHLMAYGYGKKGGFKKVLATGNVPRKPSNDTRKILFVSELPNYGYSVDDDKERLRRDYNKTHFKKTKNNKNHCAFSSDQKDQKFRSTMRTTVLPSGSRVRVHQRFARYDNDNDLATFAHDSLQFVMDLVVCFSIKKTCVSDYAKAVWMFLRARGVQLKDFYFLVRDADYFSALGLQTFFGNSNDPLVPIVPPGSETIATVKLQKLQKDYLFFKKKVDARVAQNESYPECESDYNILHKMKYAVDLAQIVVDKERASSNTSPSFTSTSLSEMMKSLRDFGEETDFSEFFKVKDSKLWPFFAQLFTSLLALASASLAKCYVSKDILFVVNNCILKSCDKLDVFGLVQYSMETIHKYMPFVAKIAGYEYFERQCYAKSLYYKVRCTGSIESLTVGPKDFFKDGQEFYDAVVELLEEYSHYFSEKERIELHKLKTDSHARLKNGQARTPPFAVGLIGGSAQGKTTCISRLKAIFSYVYKLPSDGVADLDRPAGFFEKLNKDYTIFSLGTTDKFVSGYTDQDMIVFDDAGAVKPEFAESPELGFILQAINPINTPTLQAEASSKGKIYFQNTSFVMTSNDPHFGAGKTMVCPQAILRRINVIAEVRMDPLKKDANSITDCYIITPYKVVIKRHEDFTREDFEYDPILGRDSDLKPKTCSWSEFEKIVFEMSSDFKKTQERILAETRAVKFCSRCKSTFCTCSIPSVVVPVKKSGGQEETKSNDLLKLIPVKGKDTSKVPVDYQVFPLPPKPKVTVRISRTPALDRWTARHNKKFTSTFNVELTTWVQMFLVYYFVSRQWSHMMKTGLVLVDKLTVISNDLTRVAKMGKSFCDAYLNFRKSAQERALSAYLFWNQKYEALQRALEIDDKTRSLLVGFITGVIGVVAGGAIYHYCSNKTIKDSNTPPPFSSHAFAESMASKTSTHDVKRTKIFQSLWRISVMAKEGGQRVTVSGLALSGTYVLVVNHFVDMLVHGGDVELTRSPPSCVSGGKTLKIRTSSSNIIVVERFPDSDLALLDIRALPVGQDITKFIVHGIPKNLELWRVPRNDDEGFAVSPLVSSCSSMERVTTDVASPLCIKYKGVHPIERGHCGSLIVCSETSNIVGVVVGSADSDRTIGIYVPMPKVCLKPKVIDVDIPFEIGGRKIEISSADLSKLKFTGKSSVLEVIGKIDNYPRPSATKVCRTILDPSVEDIKDPQGERFGIRHKPTPELDPVQIGGYTPQSGPAIKRALDVLQDVGEPFEQSSVDFAKTQYLVRLHKTLKNFSPVELRLPDRILTPEEGVTGKFNSTSIPGVNGMVLNTSAGYPLRGLKSNYIHRNDDVITFDCDFIEQVRINFDKLRKGERIQSFSVACLKDEVVKDKKNKSRLFYIVDVYNTLLARCIFAPVISLCAQFPFLTECAQGINNHSTQWGDMYDYLKEVGEDYSFDGDYTDYDLTMPREILKASFEVIFWFLGWCGYSSAEIEMARVFSLELIEPNVFMGPYLYRWFRGFISGNSLTFILNSFNNSIIDRVSYKILTERDDFDVQVRTIKGGDDVITSYSGVDPRYNMIAISDFLSTKGFKYTSAMKDGWSVTYKPLAQCQFFKRNFVLRENRMYSPIDHNSIVKMLTWTDSVNLHEQLLGSVESALREAYHYGPDYFSYFSDELRKVCGRTPILRGVDGDYGEWINQFGYFAFERYEKQFKILPPIRRDYPCLVDSEEASL